MILFLHSKYSRSIDEDSLVKYRRELEIDLRPRQSLQPRSTCLGDAEATSINDFLKKSA